VNVYVINDCLSVLTFFTRFNNLLDFFSSSKILLHFIMHFLSFSVNFSFYQQLSIITPNTVSSCAYIHSKVAKLKKGWGPIQKDRVKQMNKKKTNGSQEMAEIVGQW